MRKLFTILLLCGLTFGASPAFAATDSEWIESVKSENPDLTLPEENEAVASAPEYFVADVLEVRQSDQGGKLARVEIKRGESRVGQTVELLVPDGTDTTVGKNPNVEVGDSIVISLDTFAGIEQWNYVDRERSAILFWLAALLAGLLVLVSKRQGAKALIGMAISVVVILGFYVPQILSGKDPILVTIAAILLFIVPTLVFSHGWNFKTFIMLAGILFSLLVAMLLSWVSMSLAELSGVTSDEAMFLNVYQPGAIQIDLYKLLLSSIMIGTIGALDDLAITQASVAYELKRSVPKISLKKLYFQTMQVGHDHISGAVNTLFLAYASQSLPLLLLLQQQGMSLGIALQRDFLATEVIRILVSTIALVVTVPVTTALAASVFSRWAPQPSNDPHDHDGHIHLLHHH